MEFEFWLKYSGYVEFDFWLKYSGYVEFEFWLNGYMFKLQWCNFEQFFFFFFSCQPVLVWCCLYAFDQRCVALSDCDFNFF